MIKILSIHDVLCFSWRIIVVRRNLPSILSIFLCLILLPVWAQEERTPEELIRQGQLYFNRGDCELAQYIFQEALKLESTNRSAMLGKGQALVCQGATELGIEEFQKVIAGDSNNIGAYIQLTIAYVNQYIEDPIHYADNLDKAFTTLGQAESVGASNPRVLNMKGVVLYHKGDFEGARLALENALNLVDSSDLQRVETSQVHINLGRTYRALEQNQLALTSFRRGVVLNPRSFEAHSLVGEMYFLQNDCEQAIYEMTQGANLNRESLSVLASLAIVTFECGDEAEAEVWFKEALNLDESISFPTLYIYLARVYLTQGRLDDAVREAQKGALLLTDDPDGFYWLGKVYQAKGEQGAAKEAYQQALELEPTYTLANEALKSLP